MNPSKVSFPPLHFSGEVTQIMKQASSIIISSGQRAEEIKEKQVPDCNSLGTNKQKPGGSLRHLLG